MSDLETAIRQILLTYRQRYRVVSVPAADDEAVSAILAACEPVSAPQPRTALGAGDGKPGTPARRTGRPGAAKRPRATTMTTSSTQPREGT